MKRIVYCIFKWNHRTNTHTKKLLLLLLLNKVTFIGKNSFQLNYINVGMLKNNLLLSPNLPAIQHELHWWAKGRTFNHIRIRINLIWMCKENFMMRCFDQLTIVYTHKLTIHPFATRIYREHFYLALISSFSLCKSIYLYFYCSYKFWKWSIHHPKKNAENYEILKFIFWVSLRQTQNYLSWWFSLYNFAKIELFSGPTKKG